jgi:hypothetical protein
MRIHSRVDQGQDSELWTLLRTIAAGNEARASRLVAACPQLAYEAMDTGAERKSATSYFLGEIEHHVYAGDTALHIAAAAYRVTIARMLITAGADVNARNRRGAAPLHYASDGRPGSERWKPDAQAAVIEYLLTSGADPNAVDKGGVAPLHRAVRTRCAAAVQALLAHGADPRRQNGSGSTPLYLANHTTGRGGAGMASAREQQSLIIELLSHQPK